MCLEGGDMRIGVIRYWVGRPAAEHETVERFKKAATLIGHEIVELRADGKTLKGEKASVDFIINLHFASGKSTDDLTYGALWNPWNFYHGWGFSRTYTNQISNDYLISCNSYKIDRRFSGSDAPRIISQILSHTVPPDYKIPELRSNRKLFYVGVNWEKSSNRHGRHHDLLKKLDHLGILEIYGPKKIGHARPWEGFKSYKGDLPFDGTSVIEAASRAGAVLVLSSQDHLRDEIMTSRFFEGVAGGAAIIGDRHKFLEENFSNNVWRFDDKLSIDDQAAEIVSLLNEINRKPSEAFERITLSQMCLKENYDLATQLNEIAIHARTEIQSRISAGTQNATAIVLVREDTPNLIYFLNSLLAANFRKVVFISNLALQISSSENIQVIKMPPDASFPDLMDIYLMINDSSEYVSFFTGSEEIFSNYLDPARTLTNQQSGVLLTGSCIDENGEHYANAINATNSPWHVNQFAGLILRRSALISFFSDFQNFSFHSQIIEHFSTLQIAGHFRIDPLVRFAYTSSASNIGESLGAEHHLLTSQIKSGWTPRFSTRLNTDIYESIQSSVEIHNASTFDFKFLLRQIYRSLKLPPRLDTVLRRLAIRILK